MFPDMPLCENESKLIWSSVNVLASKESYLHSHMKQLLFRKVALQQVSWALSGSASI